MQITRRLFLQYLVSLFVALPLVSLCEEEETVTLAIASDPHYISPHLTDNGEYFTRVVQAGDGKMMLQSEELLEAFTEQIIALRPNYLVLTGDLTFNGAMQSHMDMAAKLRRIQKAGTQVYVLPGNHDVYNRNAASFEGDSFTRLSTTSSEDFVRVYQDYGFAQAIARDSASLTYVVQLTENVRLLMLDTNTEHHIGDLLPETVVFVRAQLEAANAAGMRVIAAGHQNLSAHNRYFNIGFVIKNTEALQALFEEYGVRLMFSGHMHCQHIKHLGNTAEIASSSLAVSPCQFGVMTLQGTDANYHTIQTDVGGWAERHNRPELVDFAKQASDFFDSAASSMGAPLASTLGLDEDAVSQIVEELNRAYFSGRLDLVNYDDPLLDAICQSDSFTANYIRSILQDNRTDNTRLTLRI